MILDSKTDFQYIGSAYGQRGIYGCWEDYAFNQHGGNKYLIELIERDPFYYRNFKFSILQALPNDVSEKEIDKLKYTWIRKLGICRTKALN